MHDPDVRGAFFMVNDRSLYSAVHLGVNKQGSTTIHSTKQDVCLCEFVEISV